MKRRRTLSSKASSWLFILPALTVVILLLLYPVTSSIFYSLTNKNLIKPTYRFLGLDNYIKTLTDPDFWTAFWNDLKWTFFSLLGQLIVGFTGALALNRIKKGSSIYRTILIIPWAIPSIVLAFSWKWILNGVYGFLPNLLIKLGLCSTAPEFLTGNLAFATLVFINIWFGSPLIMVNILSALQTVPKDQYEAAQIDGANTFQSFWHITVPHIRTVVGLLVVLRTIWIFNSFDIIYLITGGGPAGSTKPLIQYIYETAFSKNNLGYAAAMSYVLFGILLVLSLAQLIMQKRGGDK